MRSANQPLGVLDPAQLRRIEATHSGFLYQHLYAVACLLTASRLGWTRLLVEGDEDIELQFDDRRVYVQVKTRARAIQPSDIVEALERFAAYRQEHAAGRRDGRAEFVLVLNSSPSPALASLMSDGGVPQDVRVFWPGHDFQDFPPAWADVEEAFSWCVAMAEALPFLMVAPEVLVLKLAGTAMRMATGRGEFASHAIDATQAAAAMEQFAHQFHDFPTPPLNYRPHDHEPDLLSSSHLRVLSGFSGAGKTTWAAQHALLSDAPLAYFDVADLPSASVPSALARDLAARWLSNNVEALQAVTRGALSGTEALQAVERARPAGQLACTLVIDNAHRLAASDFRLIADSLRRVPLVLLAQPTSELDQICAMEGIEPETLAGWGPDTVAQVAHSEGCSASVATALRLRSLTGGLPLFVRSAIQVTRRQFGGDLQAFCDALETQTLTVETAQHAILARVFESLAEEAKQLLACASLADVPLLANEFSSLAGAAFQLERRQVARATHSARASGLLQAYGSQRGSVHDAMRPIALEHLAADPRAERQAKEELLRILAASLEREEGPERFPLFVKMLVELRRIEVLADMATEEIFHERGDFPAVWPILEEAASNIAIPAQLRFDCLDGLLFHRQKRGPRASVAPLLARMEALIASDLRDPRSQLVYLQKALFHLAELGDVTGMQDTFGRVQQLLPDDPTHRRIAAYSGALAFWKLGKHHEAERLLRPLIADYIAVLDLDLEALLDDPNAYLERVHEDDDYSSNCKRLADCFDLITRVLEGERRDPGASRGVAIRLYQLTGHSDSAAKVAIDLVWQHLGRHDYARARNVLENGLLAMINAHALTDHMIPARCLYAHVLGKTGDMEAARNELRAVQPYFGALSTAERTEAIRLTSFLAN